MYDDEEVQYRFAAAYNAATIIAEKLGYIGYEPHVIAQGAANAAARRSNTAADVHEAIAHYRVADGGRETGLIAEAAWRAANA